jgi:large repetitive protein
MEAFMRLPFFALVTLLFIAVTLIFSQNTVSRVSAQSGSRNTPGITITQTGSSNSIAESGTTDSYAVVLNTPPTDTVNVSISYPASDVALSGDTDGTFNTTFTNVNWNTPQTITITAVNDSLVEGNHPATLTHTFTSNDSNYNAITARVDGTTDTNNLIVNITDNEDATVSVTGTSLVSEAIGTTNAVATLTTTSGSTLEEAVTVALNLISNTAIYNSTSGDMYFAGPSNTVNVTFPAGAGNGATQNAGIIINNDQTVESSPASSPGFNTNENFNIALGAVTGAATVTGSPFTVSIDENDFAYIVMNPTFTVDDTRDIESNTNRTTNVQVRIVATGTGTIQVQDSFTVPVQSASLGQPNDANSAADYTAISTTVTFPAGSANNVQQPVPVTIINDNIDEFYGVLSSFNQNREFFDVGFNSPAIRATYAGVPILIPTAANDNCNGTGGLPNLPGACRDRSTLIILDNDTAAVTLTESGGNTAITEGGAGDSYSVVLNTQPTSNVTINIGFDQTQLTINGDTDGSTSLIFTSANWSTPQTVTVSAVNDTLLEANPHSSLITQSISSTDLIYNAVNLADVTVSITDNDTATIVFSNSSSTISETTSSHVVTARLDLVTNGSPGGTLSGALTANVNATLVTAESTDFTQTTTQVTFASGSANGATQNISFTIVNDRLLEGNETFTLNYTLASGTGSVSGNHIVTISDDETGAIAFTAASSTAAEGTTPHNVNGQLTISGTGTGNAQAESSVTVGITSTPGTATNSSDYSIPIATMTFSSGTNSPIIGTVSTTIVNDSLVEAFDETFTLGFGTVTGSGTINATGTHVVTIDENDTATIAFGAGNDTISESIGTFTKNITLTITSNPSGGSLAEAATLPYGVDELSAVEPEDFTLVGTTIVFPAGSTGGTIRQANVTINDDLIDEDNEFFEIKLNNNITTFSSNVTLTRALTTIQIADNDTAAISVNPTTIAVTEGSTTGATYTVVLATQPTASVIVNLSFDPSQIRVNGDTDGTLSLTFTTANWSTAQTLTVTAIEDTSFEGTHTSTIVQTASSSDSKYAVVNPADVTVNINDNDTATITLVNSSSSISEATTSHSVTARLDIVTNGTPGGTLPNNLVANVNVALSTAEASDFTQNTAQVSFISGASNGATQPINFTITNDRLLEGNETFTVSLTLSSGIGSVSESHTVNINDDESGTITFSAASSNASEGTATHNVTALLAISGTGTGNLQLENNASVAINQTAGTATIPNDYTLTTTNLSFSNSGNSPISGTIASTVVNDVLVERDETYSLGFGTVTGTGTINASGTHTVTITENDTAVVAFAPNDDTVLETAGTFTKTATLTITSDGTGTASLAADFVIPVTFTELGALEPEDFTLTLTSITFPAGSTSGTIRTPGANIVNDPIDEDAEMFTINLSTVNATPYMTLGRSTTSITITDDDTAAIAVNPTTVSVSEGSSTGDTYNVVLASKPTANVTVSLSFNQDQVTVNGDTDGSLDLTFTTANWSTAQTVTVLAVDDVDVEGSHSSTIVQTMSSTDPKYAALNPADVTVNIADNDSAGVILTEINPPANLDESNTATTFTYNVRLTSRPAQSVDVTAIFDPVQVSLNGDPDGTLTLTFTSSNWNSAQDVTITVIDDNIDESASAYIVDIIHNVSSTDPNYADKMVAPFQPDDTVSLTITDDDVAAITIDPTTLTVTETGSTEVYTIEASTEPRANVTVTLTFDDTQIRINGQVSPYQVMLTPLDYSVDVTVSAFNDALAEANPHTVEISHTSVSPDAPYNALSLDEVSVTITDNETAAILVNPASITVTEGEVSASYMVQLSSEPAADVVVTLTFDDEIIQVGTVAAGASPQSLTFTSENWMNLQTVNVLAVDDAVMHNFTSTVITQETTSLDPNYLNILTEDVVVNVVEDDIPGVLFTDEDGTPLDKLSGVVVSEGGLVNDTYRAHLNSQPIGDVTIALAFDDTQIQLAVNGGSFQNSPIILTYTNLNWNIPQTLTVTALEDFAVDAGAESITHDISSVDDTAYDALVDEAVTVTVQDNISTGPDTFTLTSPVNNATFADAAVLTGFEWQDTLNTGIGGLTFDLIVTSQQPDTTVLVFTDVTRAADADPLICNGTTCTLAIDSTEQTLLTEGVYQWSVTAKNPLGSTIASNAPFEFIVGIAPAELIVNGSFETAGVTGKDADAWVMKRKSNDSTEKLQTGSAYKRKCKPGTEFAYAGDCAFAIKLTGFSNWNYFLSQKIKNPDVGFSGNTLLLTAYVRTKDLQQSARMTFVVMDSSGEKQKLYGEIAPGNNPYTLVQLNMGFSRAPAKIVVKLETQQNYGTIVVDNVSLTVVVAQNNPAIEPVPVTGSEINLLPLPSAN